MRIRFHAEVWMGDYAWELPPKGNGEPTWDSTRVVELVAWASDPGDYFRYERWFDDDPDCPDWIKEHDGPFWVEFVGYEFEEGMKRAKEATIFGF